MNNIWSKLKKPILIQAPMENVTDTVFRQMITDCGKPDLFFSEFINCDGLASIGLPHMIHLLKYTPREKPVIAQIWGNNPENYKIAIPIIIKMGFDGIDINMGCPERNVVNKGCCSGLINNPNLAKILYSVTKQSAPLLPVSIKTRIGYHWINTTEWIGFLLDLQPAAITIHARTVKEMSKVPAHWDEIGVAVQMRNEMKSKTLIIGNGDVKSRQEAFQLSKTYGVDGIMIGRGIFQNIWLYNKNIQPEQITPKEKISLLIKHIRLFDKTWGKKKSYGIMKKFYKIYINDFNQANNLRNRLMDFTNAEDSLNFLNDSISTTS